MTMDLNNYKTVSHYQNVGVMSSRQATHPSQM